MVTFMFRLFVSFIKILFITVAIFSPLSAQNAAPESQLKDIYKSVGIINYNGSICSATLVAQNVIITSRLCLQEKTVQADKVMFEIIDPSSNVKVKVNGVAFIGSNQFIVNNINHSWALVQLAQPVPSIFKPVKITPNKINSQYKDKANSIVGFLVEEKQLSFNVDNKCFFNKTDLARNDEENYENIVIQSCSVNASSLIDGSAIFEKNKDGKIALIGIKSGAIVDKSNSSSFNLAVPVRKSLELLESLKLAEQKNRKEPSNNISNPIKGIEI